MFVYRGCSITSECSLIKCPPREKGMNTVEACEGCLLTARLVGVIEALQTDGNSTCRNDRLIAIATHAHVHGEAKKLSDLDPKIVDEIEEFFISYNKIQGSKFKPIGRHGPKRALKLVKKGISSFRRDKRKR
jgi:inorganic pyrophosphatase